MKQTSINRWLCDSAESEEKRGISSIQLGSDQNTTAQNQSEEVVQTDTTKSAEDEEKSWSLTQTETCWNRIILILYNIHTNTTY